MSHLKRQKAPKNWPIHRKGTKFIVKPSSKGIPVLIILRDLLKLARNRKETKKAIHKKEILVNNKPVKDEKKSLQLFDIITIVPSKKNYKLTLSEKGKFQVKETSEKEKEKKIIRIENKKILKGKKVQLNLNDGRNFLSDIKCSPNDSIVLNLVKNKIEKILPFKEKSKVLIIGGKHAGKEGIIKKINVKLKMAEIDAKDKSMNVLIKQLMVIE